MELRSAIAVPKPAYTRVAPPLLPYNPLQAKNKRMSRMVSIRAESSGDYRFDSDHSMADADMIVLRKRINEIKLQESKDELPQEWMEWEKKMYPSYRSMVLFLISWAQYYFLTARPSIAVAVLSLVSLSVPTSVFLATLGGLKSVGEFMAHIQLTLN